MKKAIIHDTLTEFTPKLLSYFKSLGYKSIQERLIFNSKWSNSVAHNDYEDNYTYLLTPLFEATNDYFNANKNSWFGPCTKLYAIDCSEVEQMANGVNGLVYQTSIED